MNRMRMEQRQMPLMMQNPDSLKMGGMRHGMAPMQMNNMGQSMCPMCGMRQQAAGNWRQAMGMRHRGIGMGNMGPGMRMMGNGMGRAGMGMNPATGMKIMESIPNLTDKQKKDIAELRQKQQDVMLKFRSDMQGKMKEMRETNRTKVMNLLTDDQKKWFEENTPKLLNK
jgi:hypothetical protein